MPAWDQTDTFRRDLSTLTSTQRAAFAAAVTHFAHDLQGGVFRKGLRVKKVSDRDGVWEMTWADNGRAAFSFAEPVIEGEIHIVWRRVGSHGILKHP